MAEKLNAYINKETLVFICDHIGVRVDFLVQKTKFAKDKICSWLDVSSNAYPTINQAKILAKVLKIPFAGLYMSKNNIPLKQLPLLRNLRRLLEAVSDDSSLNLAVVELIRYHDFLTSAESEMEISTTPLAMPSIPLENVELYANEIRLFIDLDLKKQFKLSSARKFYLYVRQQVESKGIFVHCFTGVDVEVARGISIFNESAPIIGINSKDRYPAKTFSIIHELVHILKKQSTLCNEMFTSFSSQDEEVFCNAVAGEVLVPADSLKNILTAQNINNFNLYTIETIAKKYSVSKEVITRRLFDIRKITKHEYESIAYEIDQNFLQEKEADEIDHPNGGGFFINPSQKAVDKTSSTICKILLIGYSDGYFSKQEVSGVLGIKEMHVDKFFMEVAKW